MFFPVYSKGHVLYLKDLTAKWRFLLLCIICFCCRCVFAVWNLSLCGLPLTSSLHINLCVNPFVWMALHDDTHIHTHTPIAIAAKTLTVLYDRPGSSEEHRMCWEEWVSIDSFIGWVALLLFGYCNIEYFRLTQDMAYSLLVVGVGYVLECAIRVFRLFVGGSHCQAATLHANSPPQWINSPEISVGSFSG